VALGLGLSGVATLSGGSALGDTTTTTLATTTTTVAAIPANAGISKDFAINADTATISGETPAVDAACSPTNTFQIGQTVLFRMYGQDLVTALPLLAANTKSVTVSIPGTTAGSTAKVAMAYSTRDGWWTGTLVTTGYAAGNYNYTMTIVTNPVKGVKGVKAEKATKGHKAVKFVKAIKAIPSMTYVYGVGGFDNQSTVTLVTSLTTPATTTTTVG
jgi:hypothetical protein